jgi:hypothetical protein
MLGRGRKHLVLKVLKVSTRRNLIESYHIVLARKRSKPSSRLALFGRIILTKGSFYKLASGDLTTVHFFTFDYKRLYKLLSSSVYKKIEIHPVVKDLLGFTLYSARRFRDVNVTKNQETKTLVNFAKKYKIYSSATLPKNVIGLGIISPKPCNSGEWNDFLGQFLQEYTVVGGFIGTAIVLGLLIFSFKKENKPADSTDSKPADSTDSTTENKTTEEEEKSSKTKKIIIRIIIGVSIVIIIGTISSILVVVALLGALRDFANLDFGGLNNPGLDNPGLSESTSPKK